jgi:hypothetical protein
MSNTICEKCLFAQNISNPMPCSFSIPSLIKDIHNIVEKNNYFVINNYTCRYGFSKNIYQENIDKFNDTDMMEYVKQQNIVKYSLALITSNITFKDTIENLNALSIKPEYITIICYGNGYDIHEMLQQKLPKFIKYKVQSFLENIPSPKALHVALETNKNKTGNLLWILDDESIAYVSKYDSIQNINYMINVEQKSAHYYRCNKIDSSFNGIFINTDNYWALSKTQDYTIENNQNTLVINYD